MSRKKVLVLGYGGHGKDEVRELINGMTGRSTPNISLLAARVIMRPWFDKWFPGKYESFSACYQDRHNWRAAWHDVISEYNTSDKARWAKEVLVENDMYVGIRSMDELEAAKDLFDVVFWVDRSDHVPPESEASNNVHYDDDYMIMLNNNGSKQDLYNEVKYLVDTHLK